MDCDASRVHTLAAWLLYDHLICDWGNVMRATDKQQSAISLKM
jgi:hypothetical protein